MGPDRRELETRIASLREKGDLDEAATCAVQAFGPEVLGFLFSVLRSESDASEVFSQACEDLWRSLEAFDGRCSMRAWLYKLAQTAMARFRRAPHRRPGRHVPLSGLGVVVADVRSRTLPHLRTSVKDQFAKIRDSLDEDDRALLILRVDRGLSWRELARTFSIDDDAEEALRRLEARLRKRFQHIKEEIRSRALEAGLLGTSHDDG
jgi:RNA polymerase sigma-70 factor (ECF subfamily)